jgi:hypothetical protein
LDVNKTAIFDSNGDGTTTNPSIAIGSTSVGFSYIGGSQLSFITSSSEKMRLDSSGNLGLGVTPSAWAGAKALQVSGVGAFYADGISYNYTAGVAMNAYQTGASTWAYRVSQPASRYEQVNGLHVWHTAASGTAGNAITFTQAMTLDASGNLLVGATSSTYSTSGRGVIEINGSSNSLFALKRAGAGSAYLLASSGEFQVNNTEATPMTFYVNGSERARIDSSGNLLVGTTTAQTGVASDAVGITLYGSTSLGTGVFTRNGIPLYVNNKNASGALIQFYCNGNNIGTISSDGTNTAYNTSSDYRLKNTIAPMTGALAKVALLKPVTYKWNADGSDGEGFIAHELAEVVPQCVTGEKDAVDEEGNPKYQGIDTSFLVATLTAALQEAVAKINSLEARLDAANL